MKKLNRKGFTAVEGLLILLIVGIIGGVGYFVWHSRQTANNSYNNSGNSQDVKYATIKTFDDCKKATGSKILETFPEQCVTKTGKKFTDTSDETSNWLQWHAPDKAYSMKIPDGWNFDQNSEKVGDLQIMDNKLEIKPGTKGKYYVTPGYGKDYDTGFVIYFTVKAFGTDFNTVVTGETKQTSLKTKAGKEILKYFYTYAKDSEGPGPRKGGKRYTYVIFAPNKQDFVVADYLINPDQTDYHQNVEEALSTVTIP